MSVVPQVAADEAHPDCRFCTLPEPWRIILQMTNFFVLAGLGPIGPGYCIIITREHISCYGALTQKYFTEFYEVLHAVQESQIHVFGGSSLFEHGRNGGCLPQSHGEDLCFHAHMHLLAATVDLTPAVSSDYDTIRIDDLSDLAAKTKSGTAPYLLMQSADNLRLVVDPSNLPSRYLRSKAAEQVLGDTLFADWQAFPAYDLVREGIAQLEGTLQDAWSSKLRCQDVYPLHPLQ